MPKNPFALGERVYLVQHQGYGELLLPGTVIAVVEEWRLNHQPMPCEIEVRLDDGRRCGGPLGHFRPIPTRSRSDD